MAKKVEVRVIIIEKSGGNRYSEHLAQKILQEREAERERKEANRPDYSWNQR